MCKTKFDLVDEIVVDWAKANKSFTAYDVTQEIRNRLPNESVYHWELKKSIHNVCEYLVDIGRYVKDQDFSIHTEGPFVYSPNVIVGPATPQTDKVSAKIMNIPSIPKIGNTTVLMPPACSALKTTTLYNKILHPDKSGRITIPNSVVRTMGWSHGHLVDLMLYKDKLRIITTNTQHTQDMIKVDKDDNLRISKKWWNKLIPHNGYTGFIAQIDNNTVTIRVVP